ncbi:MAG: hypothetical protein AAGD96_23925 [Chloroflexota bacterium]
MSLKKNGLWVVFALFVVVAMFLHDGEPLFVSQGAYPTGKVIAWLMFLAFLAYSIYCSTKENLFKTVRKIYPYLWARQIGIDLYIGLVISLFLIYLNEGSLLVVAFWLVPTILFANQATLLYIAMNYDSLVSNFL